MMFPHLAIVLYDQTVKKSFNPTSQLCYADFCFIFIHAIMPELLNTSMPPNRYLVERQDFYEAASFDIMFR